MFVPRLEPRRAALAEYLIERRSKIVEKTFVKLLTCGREAGHVRKDIPIEFLIEILLAVLDTIAVPKHLASHNCRCPMPESNSVHFSVGCSH